MEASAIQWMTSEKLNELLIDFILCVAFVSVYRMFHLCTSSVYNIVSETTGYVVLFVHRDRTHNVWFSLVQLRILATHVCVRVSDCL